MVIIKNEDGSYLCECVIQDGTERWTKPTLKEAIKSCKDNAPHLIGPNTKLKESDILFMKVMPVTEMRRVRVKKSEMQ